MDLSKLISSANPDILIFLLTALLAFISWLIKSLVENPISQSKETFNKYFEKRIEILTEVKTRLNLIAYFPQGKDNLEYKKQLQDIILRDGKVAYLSKETFDAVIKIAIDLKTDEKLLLGTISKIDHELYAQISKVQDEISFYRRFSNYNPAKKFISLSLLSIQYILSLTIFLVIVLSLFYLFSASNWMGKIALIGILLLGIYLTEKWIKK